MAYKINCPKCGNSFDVVNAFPGSKVDCSSCGTALILDIEVEKTSKKSIVPPTTISPVGSHQAHQKAIEHLASWLDVSASEISNVLSLLKSNQAYQNWKIPKGDSHLFREITSPCEPLKNIQRRVLDRLLYRIPVSNASHGFLPGRSIVTNAAYHLNTAQAVLNIDLKNAFPSVKPQRVKHLLVRYLKIPLKHLGSEVPHNVLDEVIEILLQLVVYNDGLPQGGPCSGCLLNVACITLDKNIFRLLQQHGPSYRYTRYADDMTISAPGPIPEELQQKIQKVVVNCGFQVNPQKVHYADRSKGQILEVTGLVIEKKKIRIPSKKMETFRAAIHQASQLEAEQLTQEKKVEIQSVVAFVKMVYDRLPHRIWAPYKVYLEKHKLPFPRGSSVRPHWDSYPKS